jgi:hypothetical protein
MKVPLLATSGAERAEPPAETPPIPLETKVAVAAAMLILGVSESALIAANIILSAQQCPANNGITFLSSVPFLLVPVFASFADGLRGSIVKRQPVFTAGVIIAFLSIGLLGISAYNCTFVTVMAVLSYVGVSITAALALGVLLDRMHRSSVSFAIKGHVFYVAVPMFAGKLISYVFVYFGLCTRTFLIGFSLALLLVMFITLLVPDVVVLSKGNLALELAMTQYSTLFNLNFAKIILLLVVWKVLPSEIRTLESLYLSNNVSPGDISELKFIWYSTRIVGAVKFWWLLDTNLFKAYFKDNLYRALVFILTAHVIFMFISVVLTAQPPANLRYPAAVFYFTSGIKDGFSFAWVLVTGSRAHSEVLNSFACALILCVFTVCSVGGEAISGALDSSFSVSSGQGWIAVFICAVLQLVPIIMVRYTAPKVDGSYSSKGVSSLEVSFEEVTSTAFEHEIQNIFF